MRDLVNVTTQLSALASTLIHATTVNGTSIPTTGYEGVAFTVSVSATGDTLSGTNKYELDLQDSPDGSTWSAVSDQNVQYAVGTANGAANTGCIGLLTTSDASAQAVTGGYLGTQPYVRVVVTGSGTLTTGTTFAAFVVLGYPRHAPDGVTQLP